MARSNIPFNASALTLCLAISLLCSCTQKPTSETALPVEATASPSVSVPEVVETLPPIESTAPIASTPSPTPEVFSPILSKKGAVTNEFFDDAAFFGNSLVDGFRLFSGVVESDYYAKTSLTVNNAKGQIDKMSYYDYGKIYILLGINEIGNNVETFKKDYSTMIDNIKTNHPESDIYIMSLSPVSEAKSTQSDTFNIERILAYNEALLEIAYEKECYYADIYSALSDENGYLPANVTSDGIHFHSAHYLVWLEYLQTHYVLNESGEEALETPEPPSESTAIPPTDGATNSL